MNTSPKNRLSKQPITHAEAIAVLQKKNRIMWDKAPIVREHLKAELIKSGIELSKEDQSKPQQPSCIICRYCGTEEFLNE